MLPALLDTAGESSQVGGQAPKPSPSSEWSLVVGEQVLHVADPVEDAQHVVKPLSVRLRASVSRLPNGRRALRFVYPRLGNPDGFDIASSALTNYSVPFGLTSAQGSVDYTELLSGYVGAGKKKGKRSKKGGNVGVSAKEVIRSMVREQLTNFVGDTGARAVIAGAGKAVRVVKKRVRDSKKKRHPAPAPNPTGGNYRSSILGNKIVLGKASNDWFNAYLNPFGLRVKSVGIPRPGSSPSMKVTGFVRGTGFIGQKGVGYVYGMPSLASDRACLGVTTNDYDSLNLGQFSNDTPVNTQYGGPNSPKSGYTVNLPFTFNQLVSGQAEGRIVACSLRVYYTGTELSRSGNYYAFVEPDFGQIIGTAHNSVTPPNGQSTDSLSQQDACEIFPVTRGSEAKIVWIPPKPNLFDYPGNGATQIRKVYPFCEGQTQFDGATASSCGTIMITGVPGESFYYEFINHCEYFGPGVNQALLTDSYADVVAFDALSCALSRGVRAAASDRFGDLNKCLMQEVQREGIVYKKY